VTMSILLSLVHGIYIVARPDCAVLSGSQEQPSGGMSRSERPERANPVCWCSRPGAPINFTNAAYIRRELMDAIGAMADLAGWSSSKRTEVIEYRLYRIANAQRAVAELRQRNTHVALARLESERAQHAAARTGLIAVLHSGEVFRSVEEAIRARS